MEIFVEIFEQTTHGVETQGEDFCSNSLERCPVAWKGRFAVLPDPSKSAQQSTGLMTWPFAKGRAGSPSGRHRDLLTIGECRLVRKVGSQLWRLSFSVHSHDGQKLLSYSSHSWTSGIYTYRQGRMAMDHTYHNVPAIVKGLQIKLQQKAKEEVIDEGLGSPAHHEKKRNMRLGVVSQGSSMDTCSCSVAPLRSTISELGRDHHAAYLARHHMNPSSFCRGAVQGAESDEKRPCKGELHAY
ncbi:hypothetical protein AXG93_1406s1180 [Marchantia polymorpha subsp. ruderalis]|uniref:Uncharacterized protein n=1 Tax=Marchantia polymorpha subsp. ruderalis TaxID=1480154 RepID=A0A176W2U8_MARPO|nr:hypothetical protein AXG93_1406s1180 [Marchantia polymorpha subsp. ruderalis]